MGFCLQVWKESPRRCIEVCLYFLSVIFGLFVAIPVGINLRDFHGSCILFAQVVENNTVIWPWSETSCDFVLALNMALTIVYAFLIGLFCVCAIMPHTTKHQDRVGPYQAWHVNFLMMGLNPMIILINFIIVILVGCSACVISAGLGYFCNSMMEALNTKGENIEQCRDAQDTNWDEFRIIRGYTKGMRGYRFFDCLALAAVCSWVLLLVWLVQLFINFSHSCQRCSCEVAEEKRKVDRSMLVAQRRSRMATPIGTPGGRHTPVPYGAPMPYTAEAPAYGQPAYGRPAQYQGQGSYGPPPGQQSQGSYGPPPGQQSQGSYGPPPGQRVILPQPTSSKA